MTRDRVDDEPIAVSIITPTFNRVSYLAETLESIRCQTQRNIEHIVVDDGSTDDTPTLLAQWAGDRSRSDYRVLHLGQPNCGEAAAINAGWRLAQGQFVAVVNSDDPQPPDWLEQCVAALEKNPRMVGAYPNWSMVDARGMVVRRVVVPSYSRAALIGGVRCLPGPGTVIRRALVQDGNLRRETLRYVSDYDCWLRLSLAGDFIHVPDAVASWRDHDGGLSSRMDVVKRTNELTRVLRDFFSTNLPADVAQMRHIAMANAAYESARILWRRHPFRAIAYISRAWRVLPSRLLHAVDRQT